MFRRDASTDMHHDIPGPGFMMRPGPEDKFETCYLKAMVYTVDVHV